VIANVASRLLHQKLGRVIRLLCLRFFCSLADIQIRRPKMKPRVAVAIAMLALMTACNTAPKLQSMPDVAPGPATAAAQGKSFFYEEAVDKGRGAELVTVASGLACVGNSREHASSQQFAPTDPLLATSLRQEFAKAGYGSVQVGEGSGAASVSSAADYRIVAVITQSAMSVCYPNVNRGNWADGTGQAMLMVEWQVFARGQRTAGYTTTQRGYSEITSTTFGVNRILWQSAFARSVRGLLADQGFVAFVSGTSPVNAGGLKP
jgi:hypothetical protein